jgi:hypothetical protein
MEEKIACIALGTLGETNYKLKQVIYGEGQRFTYEYYFGDSWMHTLLVEKILIPETGIHYPTCLQGEHAGPSRRCGRCGEV